MCGRSAKRKGTPLLRGGQYSLLLRQPSMVEEQPVGGTHEENRTKPTRRQDSPECLGEVEGGPFFEAPVQRKVNPLAANPDKVEERQ